MESLNEELSTKNKKYESIWEETGVESIETPKELEKLALETSTKIETDAQTLMAEGHRQLKEAVKNVGGNEKDLITGEKKLAMIDEEIKELTNEAKESIDGEANTESKKAKESVKQKLVEEEIEKILTFIKKKKTDNPNFTIFDEDISEDDLEKIQSSSEIIKEYISNEPLESLKLFQKIPDEELKENLIAATITNHNLSLKNFAENIVDFDKENLNLIIKNIIFYDSQGALTLLDKVPFNQEQITLLVEGLRQGLNISDYRTIKKLNSFPETIRNQVLIKLMKINFFLLI